MRNYLYPTIFLTFFALTAIGQKQVNAKYSYSRNFENNKYLAERGQFVGYLDTMGNQILDFIIPINDKYTLDKIPQPDGNYYITLWKENVPNSAFKAVAFALMQISNPGKPKYTFADFYGYNEKIGTAGIIRDTVIAAKKMLVKQVVYLDENGKTLFHLPSKYCSNIFQNYYSNSPDDYGLIHEGMAYFPYKDLTKKTERQRVFGFINIDGEVPIKPDYTSARNFSDGLAVIAKYNQYDELKWGAINKLGEEVVKCRFSNELSAFHNGMSKFVAPDGKFGFVNKDDSIALIAKYNWATDFYEGHAYAQDEDGVSIIDTAGKKIKFFDNNNYYFTYILDPAAPDVSSGLVICKEAKSGKKGALNMNGDIVIPFIFERINNFNNGRAFASTYDSKSTFGFINTKGKFIFIFTEGEF